MLYLPQIHRLLLHRWPLHPWRLHQSDPGCRQGAKAPHLRPQKQPWRCTLYIDDEAKLTLHGLRQHYVKLKDSEKNRKLFELLDVLEFNQVTIEMLFVFALHLLNDELQLAESMITFSSSPIELREAQD